MAQHIGLIAGGTGITPFYQLAKSILRDVNDRTKITLLYANTREEEILFKNELDTLSSLHPDRFNVIYSLDKPTSNDWNGEVGFIDAEKIKKYMPNPQSTKPLLLVCGPSP